jgi:hypothetical protein
MHGNFALVSCNGFLMTTNQMFSVVQVPEHAWHMTPVHLLATAGLRLLSQQDAADILVECAAVLASSQFLFQVVYHVNP